ncbi:MAG: cell division ATPase MinD [archaeon]
MGRVIAIASGKGGVGKTTLCANLGICLAKRGFKVLMIDADVAMANLSLLLGMHSSPITLHDVLLGESHVKDAVYDAPGGSKFIPSGLSLENYRRVDPERLESVVKQISPDYDFVLLDLPPGIEKNVLAAVSSADEVLLITTPDTAAVADVLKAKIVSQRLGIKVIGVVTNMVRNEKGEIPKEDIMKMLEVPHMGAIPFDAEVRKSFMQEKVAPLIVRVPSSPASVAIQRIAARIAGIEAQTESEKPHSGNPIKNIINKFIALFRRKPK